MVTKIIKKKKKIQKQKFLKYTVLQLKTETLHIKVMSAIQSSSQKFIALCI